MQGTEDQFEKMIQSLLKRGYGVCDHFLSPGLATGLRNNLLAYHQAGLMQPAGVGRKFDYQKNTRIRGDVIRWLDPASKDAFERQLLDKIDHFVGYLNRTCFAGINDYEFHYAYYEKFSFYKRHLDQFRSDRGRKFSFVIYLNDKWTEADGGNISLYLENETVDIFPYAGRAVFFRSDEVEHEVHPSTTRYRLSIAGWLKNS